MRLLDLLIESAGIEVVAVDFAQAKIARRAFAHFGKGCHPAGLNYGDCFAYALARQLGEPLLCKGDDFSRTDLALHKPPQIQIFSISSTVIVSAVRS